MGLILAVALILVFSVYPVQISGNILGARNTAFSNCLLAVIIAGVGSAYCVKSISQMSGLLAAGAFTVIVYSLMLKIDFFRAAVLTLLALFIQMLMLSLAGKLFHQVSFSLSF